MKMMEDYLKRMEDNLKMMKDDKEETSEVRSGHSV